MAMTAVLFANGGRPQAILKDSQVCKRLRMRCSLKPLDDAPAGLRAFDIHETGTCDAPFTTAGWHFNPIRRSTVWKIRWRACRRLAEYRRPAERRTHIGYVSHGVTRKPGAASLLDADGAALVTHDPKLTTTRATRRECW